MEHIIEVVVPFACFLSGVVFSCAAVWFIFPPFIAKLWDKTKKEL